ncbi:unnamed protein product [Amoebophrya sp. A120]|nr:unnamed protein product [Amoebophrya sp. A120]|eukprot:GSA120T00022959001.1
MWPAQIHHGSLKLQLGLATASTCRNWNCLCKKMNSSHAFPLVLYTLATHSLY